jgi:hypothetical protein
MSAHLEGLVREWRDAIQAVDKMSLEERRRDEKPLHRIVAAHNALLKYAVEEMG